MAKQHPTKKPKRKPPPISRERISEAEVDRAAVEDLKQRAQALAVEESAPSEEDVTSLANLVLGQASEATAAEATRQIGSSLGEKALPLLQVLALGHDHTIELESVRLLATFSSEAAVRSLDHIAQESAQRDVRREAKRSLFRMRSAGMDVEAILRPQKPESKVAPRLVSVLWRAFASTYDTNGDRILAAGVEKPFGGIESCIAIVNELRGIVAFGCHDSNKRKWEQKEIKEMQELWKPMRVVEIPSDYAKHLLKMAYEKNKEMGERVPPDFNRLRPLLTKPEREFERPLVYEEINGLEIKWDPELLEESSQLLSLPEFSSWVIDDDNILTFVEEITRSATGQVALPPWVEQERTADTVKHLLEKVFTPEEMKRYQRELEETAYILLHSERPRWAKVALATAMALEGAKVPELVANPFVRELVSKSVERVVSGQLADAGHAESELAVDPEELARFMDSNTTGSE